MIELIKGATAVAVAPLPPAKDKDQWSRHQPDIVPNYPAAL
jgi:hypothetical protein